MLTGIAYACVLLTHIPNFIYPHGFDKNAPVQFLTLSLVSAIFAVSMVVQADKYTYSKKVKYLALALVGALAISTLMSSSIIASLFGDTGRFVGAISTVALLLVAGFHGRFSSEQFALLVKFYVGVVELVVLGGLLQHWDLMQFPGGEEFTVSLGNLDFFAALVATSFPLLIFIWFTTASRAKYILIALAAINTYAVHLAGPKQAWVDIAITVAGILFFLFLKSKPRFSLNINVGTFLGTFAVIIWAQFIYLMPFLGDWIPVLGNDDQVKIRANFWLDGVKQFFAHPFLGVGPDQYGNYYEEFRTLSDVQNFPNILSNDAHSAGVQTLATLGIVGTLVFTALLGLVIRSFLIIWGRKLMSLKALFALGLYIAVYLTNSFISPITLSHKYLFWAVCGFLVGKVYIQPAISNAHTWRATLSVTSIALIASIAIMGSAQVSYLGAMEKYADDNNSKSTYTYDSVIPCFMFGDGQLTLANTVSREAVSEMANNLLETNPRCVRALTVLAKFAVDANDVQTLRPLIEKLNVVAPWRDTTLSMTMFYANRTNDANLRAEVEKRMQQLGMVYIPGQLG